MAKEPIRIIIVDDHPVVNQGLRSLFKQKDELNIVDCFTTGKAALNFLNKQTIDVILLDISLPDADGVELCYEIKRTYPDICILAISNHSERSIITQMLQNGASGYLLKNASIDQLTESITDAINGKPSLSQEVQSILVQSQESVKKRPRLTRREKEILKLVADGLTTDLIADKLNISPLTVETHRRNLRHKFEVKNTAALVRSAVEQRLI